MQNIINIVLAIFLTPIAQEINPAIKQNKLVQLTGVRHICHANNGLVIIK
jgi:hypothetical protein